jgi:hypothetical protein
MALPNDALFCPFIGNSTTSDLRCCHADKQDSSLCRDLFENLNLFANGCGRDCFKSCSSVEYKYASTLQNTGLEGTGAAPIHRHLT